MAGKAVAVAKAAVKKPVAAKAKKPVSAKAVAKKPVAAKAVAKKPAVAKFNLNKLMMLIVRDAPKKGKKMMGGYKKTDTQILVIKKQIFDFINKEDIRNRIRNRLIEVYDNNRAVGNRHNDNTITYAKSIADLLISPLIEATSFKFFVGSMNGSLADELQNYSYDTTTNAFNPKSNPHIKDIYDINFFIIIIALCKVYYYFHNSADDVGTDNITATNPPT